MTIEEAKAFIAAIVAMRENATDEQALQATAVYPFWKVGVDYKLDTRVQHNKTLYKCRQEHTSQDTWAPDATPALWVVISLEAGTMDQPITAARGMEYEKDKYYLDPEDNAVYLCIQSGVLHYMPHELINIYFTTTN